MYVLDTNVLVYAADRGCAEHGACRELVEGSRRSAAPWYLTWGIVYEFLRVVTHPRVMRRPWKLGSAYAFIEALMASPSLDMLVHTVRHARVASLTLAEVRGLRGNLLHDAHTAILMREHGIHRIYTRDTDFHRFAFLEVIDPLG
jgi:toxin-antitoxin system PIN domain toxin